MVELVTITQGVTASCTALHITKELMAMAMVSTTMAVSTI